MRMLTDDDIFISYAHLDGGTYAEGLADELLNRGFSCYVDTRGTEPGSELPAKLRRRIRGCAMLVIIGTDAAASRVAIEEEIREFLGSGRRSSIVPIDFGRAVFRARWYGLVEGIVPEVEISGSALADGNPSSSVIGRIEKQFNFTRRNQRLRRATLATASLLAILILASVAATVYAAKQLAHSREARNLVRQAQIELDSATKQLARAQEDLRLERRNLDSARAEKTRYEDLATKIGLRLEEKTRLAGIAEQRSKDANAAAQSARIETEHQQAISDSLRLANQSQRGLAQASHFILPSVQLAVDALEKFPTVEADSALRAGLSKLPRRLRTVQYEGDIVDASISPDGKHVGILSSTNIIRIYRSGELKAIKKFPCRDRKLAPSDYRRRLITISDNAAYAAVVSGNDAIVVNLKTDTSRSIELVQEGSFVQQIALSPDGKYIALAYSWRPARYPHLSGAKVLDTESGSVITTLAEDLSMVSAVAFGPEGDLAISGSRLIDLQSPEEARTRARLVGDARRVVVWRLSTKLDGREGGTKLTKKDFEQGVEMPLSMLEGELASVPNDSIAIGPNPFMIATRSGVYELTGEGYKPASYIPYTTSGDGSPTSERRYGFNRAGTEAIVLTARSFSSTGEWQIANLLPDNVEKLKDLAQSSRGSWTLEWWDLGGYPNQVFQAPAILDVKFQGDNRGILLKEGRDLPVRCLSTTDNQHSNLVESKQPQKLDPVLTTSPNLDFMVTTAEDQVSVIKACEPVHIPIPFPGELENIGDGLITQDARFVGLIGFIKNTNARLAVDLYELSAGKYQRLKLVQLPWPPPLSVVLSADGRYLNVSTRQGFRLWDVTNEREVLIPDLEGGGIELMWFSPDAQFLIVFDVDRLTNATTRILRLKDRSLVDIWKYPWTDGFFPTQMFFSPSGRFVVDLWSLGKTRLIDLQTRKVQTLPPANFDLNVAFSADERYVAMATQGEGVLVYRTEDVNTGPFARLYVKGRISALAISPDNRHVLIGNVGKPYPASSYAGVLRLWPLQTSDLIREGIERLSVKQKLSH